MNLENYNDIAILYPIKVVSNFKKIPQMKWGVSDDL